MRTMAALACAAALASTDARAAEPGDHRAHPAPHGGALAVLGDELAHLELVRDAPRSRLTLYVLDASAERGVRLPATRVPLVLTPAGDADPEPLRLVLEGVADPLTGETRGDTSEFRVEHPRLGTLDRFDVQIPRLVVRGTAFEDVRFAFPEGNESPAPDADDDAHSEATEPHPKEEMDDR